MFTKTRDNIKFISSVLFAVTILVGGMFVLTKKALAVVESSTTVIDQTTLLSALADEKVGTITIGNDFTVTQKIDITRPVTIDGTNKTISFTGNVPTTWSSAYIFQVYGTTDVTIKDIKLTSGNAGLLINKSTATLLGTIDVSGNGFGGIESSGSTLTVSGATLTNTTEAYALPTLWEDGTTGTTVVGFTGTTNKTIKPSQVQYYLNEVNTTTKFISTNEQLISAINSQADGQVWKISAGDYGLDRFNNITVGGQAGWYFPITANNLTIEGIGNPIIYGKEFSLNGNWSTQNLISVFGNNVTIKGLTLMPKAEGNKTIEVLGNDISIENVIIQPNTKINSSVYDGITNDLDKAFSKEWGGSIYFSHQGNHTVRNVTINNGGISFRYSPSGTHVTFDNVNIVNKTSIDDINSYRYSSGFNNTDTSTTSLPNVIYKIDASTNNLTSALLGAKDGDTIELASDITVTSQVNIDKALTIDGKGYKLNANFAKTDNSNNSAIGIQHSNVTIKNLIEDGTGSAKLHGINIYLSNDVSLDGVTVSNNPNAGMIVNGSTVSVNKITTLNNGWGGINVDQGSGVTAVTTLTVNGKSSHTESNAAIWRDDNSKTDVTVVDTNNQYTSSVYTHDTSIEGTKYVLDTIAPIITVLSTNPISVLQGSTYTDAGATVTDNDANVKVIPTGTVNTNIVGTYTITYNATDFAGNTATSVTRTVDVYRQSSGGGSSNSGGGYFRATPATPATPANPGVNPATPAIPATPGNPALRSLQALQAFQANPAGRVLGAETYNFTKLMKKGLSGTEVMELQKFLNTLGFDCGTADGKFGQKTRAAVIKFQLSKGLKGDGIVGAMTRGFLK